MASSSDCGSWRPFRRSRLTEWIIRALAVAFAALFLLLAYDFNCGRSGTVDFYMRRGRLTAIVDKIKTSNLRPCTGGKFAIPDLLTDKPAKPRDPHQADYSAMSDDDLAGVYRDASGAYTVLIFTKDFGHLGRAGYLYSGAPSLTSSYKLGAQIAPHWWVIYDDMD